MPLVILDSIDQNIAKVTLNDPESLNAMSDDMAVEFLKTVNHIRGFPTPPRAIILTGSGRAFSAGGSLQMLERKRHISPEDNKRRMIQFYDSFLSIRNLNTPIIAMINGHAVGAGLCLACGCDIRVASTEAKLGFPFSKLGLHPGMGATYFVPKIVGLATATELLATGRTISAEEGFRVGMISKISPPADLEKVTLEIAREISESGPETVRALIESLRGNPIELKSALEREASCQAKSYGSAEFAEGVKAAIEKRKAKF